MDTLCYFWLPCFFLKLQTCVNNNNPEGNPLKSVGLILKIAIGYLSGRFVIIGYFLIYIVDTVL